MKQGPDGRDEPGAGAAEGAEEPERSLRDQREATGPRGVSRRRHRDDGRETDDQVEQRSPERRRGRGDRSPDAAEGRHDGYDRRRATQPTCATDARHR